MAFPTIQDDAESALFIGGPRAGEFVQMGPVGKWPNYLQAMERGPDEQPRRGDVAPLVGFSYRSVVYRLERFGDRERVHYCYVLAGTKDPLAVLMQGYMELKLLLDSLEPNARLG